MSATSLGIRSTMGRRSTLALAVAALALVAMAGCKNTNFLSTKDEVRLGRDASGEIERQYHLDSTSPDAERVRRIGERLLAHARERPTVPYSFKVLAAKDVNAVSLPGGPVYVFRGLLDMAGNDDDALAAVIGHELGHVNARHAAKLISQQMAANVGIALAVPGQGAQNLAGLAQDLISLGYSRDDEYEADRRGLSYAYKAGYDPEGMVRFFRKLSALETGTGSKRTSAGPTWLRSHPLTAKRIEQAERVIAAHEYRYGQ